MRLDRFRLNRTLLVPALVLLLGVCVIASITVLQARARDSADAQLRLSRIETELNVLQAAPFRASTSVGGSPQVARAMLDGGEREVDAAVSELLGSSPPAVLIGLTALLRANYATLERIYAIGVAGEYGHDADVLAAGNVRTMGEIVGRIHGAQDAYAQRSATADQRATIGSAVMMLLLVGAFCVLYRRSARARATAERLVLENGRLLALSRAEALTDTLTGLPNRRALGRDLELVLRGEPAEHVLAMMDLDGFKHYNDTFGHPAGDILLTRLGERLAASAGGRGTAYRMGGDEFCLLATVGVDDVPGFVWAAADALSDNGEAFAIGCSIGWVRIPDEVGTAEDAMRLADQRMYAHKVGRSSSTRQSSDVLLKVLSERSPQLHGHLNDVADLAEALSRAEGLVDADVYWIRLAAELHDVGKIAIPDAILDKPGALSDEEWTFMRRHTLIGERIVGSAPSLEPAARLVRSSHERYDGKGYPDGLCAGEIDVGASIIAICDAYDAMVTDRVYREPRSHEAALAELRRCAGTQFDPALVERFCALVEPGTGAACGRSPALVGR